MTTVAPNCGPKLESLSQIDISTLSQSELHSLSLCSDSAYDLRSSNDVVVPQLDRSLFNESAGSRRQTYSRLRHHHHRSRVPGLHPSTSNPKPPSSSDPENHAILHFLKYFIQNPNSHSPPPPPPPLPQPTTQPVVSGVQEKAIVLMNGEKKRKRGRKPKDNKKLEQNGVEGGLVNKNGEVVDLNNLENHGDELYSMELMKRTVGLQTDEEAINYIRSLEGQWGSTRKRRKYVDASGFGDILPVGWKLLLALRRRDNRVWVYCRRYVSPTGQQFVSCKEASSYLRSHFLSSEANQLIQQADFGGVNNFNGSTSLVLSTDVQEHPHSLQEKPLLLTNGEEKRKRGRKRKKLKESGIGVEVEIVNRNGEVVDLNNLENHGDELYSVELMKRTVGLQSDDEAIGYIRGLEGQWCSTRKRRKYVDANDFGDALPNGWKLLLALRRRDGRVWVYCRRYVSPTGQQFVSCKEASSYLRSHLMSGQDNQLIQPADDSVPKSVNNVHSNTSLVLSADYQDHPHSLQKGDVAKHDTVAHSVVPGSSTLHLQGNEICSMEMDNLPEVKVQDLFECYKCNLRFEEKNAYLQHLFSLHQRTTRRYRVGSVGDGVIIRDGKYECQFCHKVFDERRSYNGHVGVHVRNNARGTVDVSAAVAADKSFQSPPRDESCKIDALSEIAQTSATARPATEDSSMPSNSLLNMDGSMVTKIDQVVRSSTDTACAYSKECKAGTCLEHSRNQPDKICMEVDKDKSGEILADKVDQSVASTNDSEQPEGDNMNKYVCNKPLMALGNKQTKPKDDVQSETMKLTIQENASQNALASSMVSMVQLLNNDSKHSEGDDRKKDGTHKVEVGDGSSLSKGNGFDLETMELSFQENASPNGLTSSSASMVQFIRCDFEHSVSDGMRKDGNDKLTVGPENSLTKAMNSVDSETVEFTLQHNATPDGLASFSESMQQPFHNSTGILSGSSKDNGEFSDIGQNLDNGTEFEEFRLDEIDHFKYSFDDVHESPSLPIASIGLGNDARMTEAFESVGFDSGGIILNMEEPHLLSTVCVWCRAEFKLEGYDTEAHSDSIGFMCPDCKAKISGHLESGLSMNPHGF